MRRLKVRERGGGEGKEREGERKERERDVVAEEVSESWFRRGKKGDVSQGT